MVKTVTFEKGTYGSSKHACIWFHFSDRAGSEFLLTFGVTPIDLLEAIARYQREGYVVRVKQWVVYREDWKLNDFSAVEPTDFIKYVKILRAENGDVFPIDSVEDAETYINSYCPNHTLTVL